LRWTHHLPWSTSCGNVPQFVPQLHYNNPAFGSTLGRTPDATATRSPVVLHSYHPLQDIFATNQEELIFLRADPFLIVSRQLVVAATSLLQYLNFIEKEIEMCSSIVPDQRDVTLEQLRFNSARLHRVANFSRENQQTIKEQRGDAVSTLSHAVLTGKIDKVAASLEEDYEYIITRCDQLVSRCESGASILVSAAQLAEAQKGICEARQIQSLTRLAFVFVPLSYVGTLFGMQVSALQTHPPMWTYFAIAIPLTILCWLISGSLGVRLRGVWLSRPLFVAELSRRWRLR
jgi:Mg2+ and Co2+ transporter CorA